MHNGLMCVCGNQTYRRDARIGRFSFLGKTYRCEVCNGTSHHFFRVRGMCKVQSTQKFVLILFYVWVRVVSCNAGHIQA